MYDSEVPDSLQLEGDSEFGDFAAGPSSPEAFDIDQRPYTLRGSFSTRCRLKPLKAKMQSTLTLEEIFGLKANRSFSA